MTDDRPRTTPPGGEYPFPPPSAVEPSPAYAWLREHRPVHRVRLPSGNPAFLVTRYDDVRTVLSDPRFSRAAAVAPGAPRRTDAVHPTNGLFETDPPEHTRLRRAVSPWFTRDALDGLRPFVEDAAERLVTAALREPAPVDLMTTLAQPLPLAVLGRLLGLPDDDRHAELTEWVTATLSLSSHSVAHANAGRQALRDHIAAVLRHKRARPDDSLLSALANAEDAARLTPDEQITMGVTLTMAGFETTVAQLGLTLIALLDQRDRYRALCADRTRVPDVVEEALRLSPLIHAGLLRVTLRDVTLSGTVIPAGSAVLAATHSANRDRPDGPHLAFGHGPHYCLGAALARLELTTVLHSLVRHAPELRLATPARDIPLLLGGRFARPATLPVLT